MKAMKDIHYVFSGLAPLSVRIIERMMDKGGFGPITDLLKMIQGGEVKPENEAEKEMFKWDPSRRK